MFADDERSEWWHHAYKRGRSSEKDLPANMIFSLYFAGSDHNNCEIAGWMFTKYGFSLKEIQRTGWMFITYAKLGECFDIYK